MDVAASEFYKGGKYDLDFKSPDDPSRYISSDKLADLYKSFVKDYPGDFLNTCWSDLQAQNMNCLCPIFAAPNIQSCRINGRLNCCLFVTVDKM